MPRIRTIKPDFFQSETMAQVSMPARLLAIALLTMADCEGRLRHVPMSTHANVFPWEPDMDVDSLIAELEGIDYCCVYRVEGKTFISVHGFNEHQRLSGTESKQTSKLPAPPDGKKNFSNGSSMENHSCRPGKPLLGAENSQFSNGTLEREREREREREEYAQSHSATSQSATPKKLCAPFADFWSAWPKKLDKHKAEKAWKKLAPDAELASTIIDAVRAQSQHPDWLKDGGQFIPYPATWLNAKRWQDETVAPPARKFIDLEALR